MEFTSDLELFEHLFAPSPLILRKGLPRSLLRMEPKQKYELHPLRLEKRVVTGNVYDHHEHTQEDRDAFAANITQLHRNTPKEWADEYGIIQNGKRPLLLMSGGNDSTLLLLKMLKFTSVDIMYIPGVQGPIKSVAEVSSIHRIINLWIGYKNKYNETCENTLGEIFWINPKHASSVKLTQDTSENTIRLLNQEFRRSNHTGYVSAFGQPCNWISMLVSHSNRQCHTGVYMAYISSDSNSRTHHLLKAAFDNLSKAVHHTPLELHFPIHEFDKLEVIRRLDDVILRNTWVCELANTEQRDSVVEYTPCGSCNACLDLRDALIRLKRYVGFTPEYKAWVAQCDEVLNKRKNDECCIKG